MDWFLYDIGLRHERVKSLLLFQAAILYENIIFPQIYVYKKLQFFKKLQVVPNSSFIQ